jgi:hypothetical protein
MEKQENSSPERPPQSQGQQSVESKIDHALNVSATKTNVQPVSEFPPERIWKYGKKSDMYSRHRKEIFNGGLSPETVEHISNGVRRGCQCMVCKEKRNEFEYHRPSEAIPIQENANPIEELSGLELPGQIGKKEAKEGLDYLCELVDEETAAIVLDTFRKAGEIYYRGKLGGKVSKVWEQDEKEMRVLGKLGKKCFDKYASIPDFKHKELVLLGFFLSQSVGLRVAATLKIQKELEPI